MLRTSAQLTLHEAKPDSRGASPIVGKVGALMVFCDRLEASLDETAATRRRLLDALLAEALAPVDQVEMVAAE